MLDAQQISDIIEVIDECTFKRPIYAGSCIATVKSNDEIKVITIRATAFDPCANEGGNAEIVNIDPIDSKVNQNLFQRNLLRVIGLN